MQGCIWGLLLITLLFALQAAANAINSMVETLFEDEDLETRQSKTRLYQSLERAFNDHDIVEELLLCHTFDYSDESNISKLSLRRGTNGNQYEEFVRESFNKIKIQSYPGLDHCSLYEMVLVTARQLQRQKALVIPPFDPAALEPFALL